MARYPQFAQLGGDAEAYQPMTQSGEPQRTDAGNLKMGVRLSGMPDLAEAEQYAAAVNNMDRSLRVLDRSEKDFAAKWYPRVHDATMKGVRQNKDMFRDTDNPEFAGAALVGAVSPNMDWERNNIDAFGEFARLSGDQWAGLRRGDAETREGLKGMGIYSATSANLQKAARIVEGEDPEEVLKGPKITSFSHNIYDPSNPAFVTIDGRQADLMSNRSRPWSAGRGIESWARGNVGDDPTRYDQYADIVRTVGARHGLDPSAAQAIGWEGGKKIETLGGYSKGPPRVGQPYWDPETGADIDHRSIANSRYRELRAGWEAGRA